MGAGPPRRDRTLLASFAERRAVLDRDSWGLESFGSFTLEERVSRYNAGNCDLAGGSWADRIMAEGEPGEDPLLASIDLILVTHLNLNLSPTSSARRHPMRQFAANLSILFPTLPYLERFRAAAESGFRAVESWWPGDALAEGITADDIVRQAETYGLEMILLNFAAGDMKAGDRGLAGDPDRVGAFRANVPVAIDLAHRLGCRKLNALAGNVLSEAGRSAQMELLVESVTFAADAAAAAGMSVMLEALNQRETPRYLLPGTDVVLGLIERIGRPNVGFQLDVYHVAMAGEDPRDSIRRAGPRIGHVQLADAPGRHEPGTGELPFLSILEELDAARYSGPIGLEFAPLDPAAPDFSCVERLGGRLSAPRTSDRRTER